MTEAREFDELLVAALPAQSLFAVGGRVRDEIRSELDGVARSAKDLDYVVLDSSLASLVERLKPIGRVDIVGAAFAVVKLTVADRTVDVALPRRERSTGVGHREFSVEVGPDVSLEEDLARRDFRMNMLARALPSGTLVDPYGGIADIEARRIDLLRPSAFEEDPLRMLRAAQFAARFEFEVSENTLAAMRSAAPLVATVSADRIHDELVKLLERAVRPSIGVEILRKGGLLPFILPEVAGGQEVEQNRYHAYDVYYHSLATLDATAPGDVVLRLAALLHDIGKPSTRIVEPDGTHFYGHDAVGAELAQSALRRLRFSEEHTALVTRLVRNHMYATNADQTSQAVRRFIRRIGPELIERQTALRKADIVGSGLPKRDDANERFEERVRAELAHEPALSVRDLAIDGHDILALQARLEGERLGPFAKRSIGAALEHVLERVTDEPGQSRPWQLAQAEEWLRRQ